ncbi:MAG: radical SAM protein [Deltaproteobacteria bacterium]|nr:radical SAM protein [Deltaproteobacteria bacterium]
MDGDSPGDPAIPVAAGSGGLLARGKFEDPRVTLDGSPRATVALGALRTLWFATGTRCNLACRRCYIESSPRNDRLAYLSAAEVGAYLDEIERARLGTVEIGFTGGEPFLNPGLLAMLGDALGRGLRVLVLTNAMRPMMRAREGLLGLLGQHGDRLVLRVSLDHHTREGHERERGPRSWEPTLAGLRWLAEQGFAVHVAGRRASARWVDPAGGEDEAALRAGYARLFRSLGLALDAADPARLVLFPEMDAALDVPEITTACWERLGKRPGDVMCASSRMVVKRRGAARPVVVACTLLPYDPRFELGCTLGDARATVALNHPHCARFCVLGGASCAG